MTHTPEPWLARPHGIAIEGKPFEMAPCKEPWRGQPSCAFDHCRRNNECLEWKFWQGQMVGESMSAEDAQRAVLCVNACKGITNEALGEGVVRHTVEALRDTYFYLCEQDDPEARALVSRLAVLINAHGLDSFTGPLFAHHQSLLAGARR